jgi:hypothetical protein
MSEQDFRIQIEDSASEFFTGKIVVVPIPDEVQGAGAEDASKRPFDLVLGAAGRAAFLELKQTHGASWQYRQLKRHQERYLLALARTKQIFAGVVIQFRYTEKGLGAAVRVVAIPITRLVAHRSTGSVRASLTVQEALEIGIEIYPIPGPTQMIPDRWNLRCFFGDHHIGELDS